MTGVALTDRERRLLCACARGRQSRPRFDEPNSLLREGIDWQHTLALGRRHRMLPFLHRHLRDVGEAGATPETREQLRLAYERNAAWNLAMTAALVRLLKALGAERIRPVAFKGPVTSFALYGDLGLRGFTDVDVLIDGHDFHRAHVALRTLGLSPEMRLSARQARALVRYRNELTFSSEDQSFHVDLHWRILVHHLRMLPDDAGVWERAGVVDLAGVSVHTLGATDLLSYFCARAAVDSWATLYRICDIAEAVRVAGEAGLADALDRASRVGKRRMMLVGLLMAHELLRARVPDEIVREARKIGAVVRTAAKAEREMFDLDARERGLLRRDLSLLRLLDSPRERLAFAMFLPLSPGPHDIKVVDLPEGLWWAYRLIRVVRAGAKWMWALAK